MKKKFIGLLLTFAVILNVSVKADEGMWLPLLLSKNEAEMKALGLRLTAEQLYSINNGSLKDAIVRLDGGGCTGEIISSKGLLLTNHHCAYSDIVMHSSVGANYIDDGFWARKMEDELPNPKKTASFLIRIDDVSEKVLKGVNDKMSHAERDSVIEVNITEIIKAAEKDTHYEATVKEMFEGSEYYLFIYETFLDVRLVGAPPSSIGKFGADTDNWMWPRHTGDFSLYRVYMGPDGKPAAYSKDNIPLEPKHYLPISIKGLEVGDFAMIWGYPGITDRYRTSYGIQLTIDQLDPAGEMLRRAKMDAMKPYMDADEAVRIMYADSYAYFGNFWKKSREERKALIALDVYDQKKSLEEQFAEWVDADAERRERYGEVLSTIEEAYKKKTEYQLDKFDIYINEFIGGSQAIQGAVSLFELWSVLSQEGNSDAVIQKMSDETEKTFEKFDYEVEKALFATMAKHYYEGLPVIFHTNSLKDAAKKFKGDWDKYAEWAFKKSFVTSPEAYEKLLKRPKIKKITKDPLFALTLELYRLYFAIDGEFAGLDDDLAHARRLFIEGLRLMQPDELFYPDANSTMRVTYGTIEDYYPRDGVHYLPFTYLDGVMEKEIPGDEEFHVDQKLKHLYENKDFGQYGVDGKMPVCFLTNNDITGGNSGSPVINANGEIIGTAFDGNSEAMSSDLEFDKALQRTIICDIRYVLFIIDKFAEAQNIIDELDIVK